MPRLKGNSSQGSKPITWLSRTFNCTPHCCPQKQQWVLTSCSGSALVDSRTPVIPERCGPSRSMIFSSSTGRVATLSSARHAAGQPFAPGPGLRQAEQRATAARADLLIMTGTSVHLVGEPQIALDGDQIPHHHGRRVRGAAPAASGLLATRAGVLVEADADLRRPLEDVEQ